MLRAVDGFGADAVDALVDFSRSLVVSVFELALLFSLLVALVVPFLALELVIGPLVGASGSGGAVGLFLTPSTVAEVIELYLIVLLGVLLYFGGLAYCTAGGAFMPMLGLSCFLLGLVRASLSLTCYVGLCWISMCFVNES